MNSLISFTSYFRVILVLVPFLITRSYKLLTLYIHSVTTVSFLQKFAVNVALYYHNMSELANPYQLKQIGFRISVFSGR